MAPDSQSSGEPLQFDSAIPANASTSTQPANCVGCKRAIQDQYFEVNGAVLCAGCKDGVVRRYTGAITASALAKAFIFGLLAAMLGAIAYYTFMVATKSEFALVTYGIGYMVGYAVRQASGRRGGLPFQLLAVVLTYLAIGAAYLAFSHSSVASESPASLLWLALNVPVLIAFSGASGVLSAIIILVGLRQAWRMNTAPKLAVRGPYRIASSPAA